MLVCSSSLELSYGIHKTVHTFGDIVAEIAVDVALSDAGNQTSER